MTTCLMGVTQIRSTGGSSGLAPPAVASSIPGILVGMCLAVRRLG
jgi:hypothetical protein